MHGARGEGRCDNGGNATAEGTIGLTMRPLLIAAALALGWAQAQAPLAWEAGEALLAVPEAGATIAVPAAQLGSAFGPERQPFAGRTVRVGVIAGGPQGTISGVFYQLQGAWEALSGAALELVELPLEELLLAWQQQPQLDGAVIPAWALGDYLAAGALQPLEPWLRSGADPDWSPERFAPRSLARWGETLYGVPLDPESYLLYWREDILGDPLWRERYQQETGQPLPALESWEAVLALARYFNGRNWDESDPDPDSGLVMPLADPYETLWQFLAVSEPYVVRAGAPTAPCDSYWFNPTTFAPLINSQGHMRGLERFVALAQEGTTAQPIFTLRDAEDLFLRGKAMFMIAPADLGALAQDPTRSLIEGRWRAGPLPGASETYDLCQGSWETLERPNRIGNALGHNWQGVVLAPGEGGEATYSLFALLASPAVQAWSASRPWSGVAPAPGVADAGAAAKAPFATVGWQEDELAEFLAALAASREAASAAPLLRIEGTARYWALLASELRASLIEGRSAPEALDRTAQAWQALADELGLQEQLRQYRTMLDLAPVAQP